MSLINSIIPKATTLPSKIHSLKFKIVPSNPFDDDYQGFEFIGLKFITDAKALISSNPDRYLIEIKDLDTDIVKKYIQPADDPIYYYWQRSSEYIPEGDILSEPIPNGIVNGRVFITPINDLGSGPRNSFILPLNKMNYISNATSTNNRTSLVLAKFWHLFSPAPEVEYNRPKQMHIYLDVDEDVIINDKLMLGTYPYRFGTVGDYQTTNQNMYRWLVKKNEYLRLNENNEFVEMTFEEIEFIKLTINSFLDLYRRHVSENGGQGEPTVFKIAFENPRDHNDSIIIYLMKGKSWEL